MSEGASAVLTEIISAHDPGWAEWKKAAEELEANVAVLREWWEGREEFDGEPGATNIEEHGAEMVKTAAKGGLTEQVVSLLDVGVPIDVDTGQGYTPIVRRKPQRSACGRMPEMRVAALTV